MGPAVVKPDAKSDPGKAATSKAKEVSGDAQQKGEKSPEKMKKLAAGDEVDHDGDELSEAPKTKAGMQDEMITAMKKMKKGEMEHNMKQGNEEIRQEERGRRKENEEGQGKHDTRERKHKKEEGGRRTKKEERRARKERTRREKK